MGMTISTHNGTAAHRGHNIRLESVVSKQDHIVPGGNFEIWHDEAPREAYERIFGEYVAEYNAKQKRPERRIKDYYADICNDKKKNAVYEMIVAVGNKENHPPEELCKQILSQFVYGNEDTGYPKAWSERNPQFELIGAYYHADEQGVPHLHLDYVPVADGYQRGMWAQNGLDKALRQMGYEHKGNHATPQIQWEKAENKRLQEICRWHGIEVEHPMAAKGVEHVHTELFKAKAEANQVKDALNAEIDDLRLQKDMLQEEVATLHKTLQEQNERYDERLIERNLLESEISGLESLKEHLEVQVGEAEVELQEMVQSLNGLEKDCDEVSRQLSGLKDNYHFTEKLAVHEMKKKTQGNIVRTQDLLRDREQKKQKKSHDRDGR